MDLVDVFATGYATCTHPAALPVTARTRIDLFAAASTPGHPDLVAEAGRRAAHRTALHRNRLALYADHATLIAAAARPYLKLVDVDRLLQPLALLAGRDRATRAAQALTTITGMVHQTGPTTEWDDANSDAHQAVAARGWAEADTAPAAGPADPHDVDQALPAATAITAVAAGGGWDWTRTQLARLAWDLTPDTVLDADDPAATMTAIIDRAAPVAAAAGDLMHQTLAEAFVAWFAAGDGTDLGQIAWVTEADDRVCPDCDSNEENSPYPADSVPDMPAHPTCRCSLERA